MRLFVAGLVCAVHAILPFLFEKTASAMVEGLHDRMVANRRRLKSRTAAEAGRADLLA